MAVPDNLAKIQVELDKDGNNVCAECYSINPGYASLNLGCFVCQKCAKFHKKLAIDRNNVVAIKPHSWTDEQVMFIQNRGNSVVNLTFEKYIPKYYHRPDPDDPPIVREQFIKAKYEREEFKDISRQEAYNQGSKIGSLFKRGKDNDKFLRRKFVLKEPEGTLEYFIKFSDRVPKDTIAVRNIINIYIAPNKIGHANGMQVTYEKDGVRRNLFLYGENGKVTSDWYHVIRASMLRHKFQNFPEDKMKKYLNTKIEREGWMSKTGPKRQEKFRKRWFSLIDTMVWYYAGSLDPHPLGYIPLGSKTFGYGVKKGFPSGVKVEGYGLTIHTPERIYALNCVSLESREEWVQSITKVLNACTAVCTPTSPDKQLNPPKGTEICTDQKPALNQSSFSSLSKKFRPCSDSESSSLRSNRSQKKPMFEKKTNKPGAAASGEKYTKKKKTSMKRQSTTKKVQDNPDDLETTIILSDNGEDIEEEHEQEEEVTTNGDASDLDEPMYPPHPSKKYSDDSEDDSEDDDHGCPACDQSLSSSYSDDSETDLVFTTSPLSVKNPAKPPEKPPRKGTSDTCDHPRPTPNNTSTNAAQPTNDPIDAAKKTGEELSETTPALAQPTSPGKQANPPVCPKPEKEPRKTVIPSEFPPPPPPPEENPYSFAEAVDSTSSNAPKQEDKNKSKELRKNPTAQSLRRVQGHERISLKKPETSQRFSNSSVIGTSMSMSETKEAKPRPIDITLTNQMEEDFWFMAFQIDVEIDEVESYITPWVGAQIAETPASVGPIRIPPTFEIAVIDTAPGGFGLQRTTGPFYVEPGDVWEVEMPSDGAASPEMFYCEGLSTEDDSILVYAHDENTKKFEIAIFKSGRKLFSRKNVKAGDSVSLKVKQAVYLMAVDEDTYYDMEGQDIRASECIGKASCIDINYRQPRMKVVSKKRGEKIFFTKL